MGTTIIGMGIPGGFELVIILVIVIMIFGVGKLPKVAKELGSGIRGFQKSIRGEDDDDEDEKKNLDDDSKSDVS